MAVRRLIKGLRHGKRNQIFRAVEDILRSDPILSGVIRTWRTFEGDPDDLAPPSDDQCPWVRLRMEPRPIAAASTLINTIQVTVAIELVVEGTCQDDLIDLWEAFEDALTHYAPYRGTTVQEWLYSHAVVDADGNPIPGHGGYGLAIEQPAYYGATAPPTSPNAPIPSPTMLGGIGKFTVTIRKPA